MTDIKKAFEHIQKLANQGYGNDHVSAEHMLVEIFKYSKEQMEAVDKDRREAITRTPH